MHTSHVPVPGKPDTGSVLPTGANARSSIFDTWPILVATVVGLTTAFFRLDAKGLWGDEVWEVGWSHQQPLVATFFRFLTPPDLPLHFMLTQLATHFETNEFLTRFPAALLGAATVTLLFLIGRRVLGTRTGFIAALLLAFAPYHVWHSQDARPYAGLAFYSLLSLFFFYQLLERPSWGSWIGFTLAGVLNIYNHLFALFPLLVEVCYFGLWVIALWIQNRNGSERIWRDFRHRVLRSTGAVVGGLLAILIISIPLIEGISNYLLHRGPGEIEAQPFQLDIAFLSFIFGLLGSGAGWPLWIFASLSIGGLITALYQRKPVAVISLLWLGIPFVVLWIVQPRHIIIPRYFLFMQPVYLLLVAYGATQVSDTLTAILSAKRIGTQKNRRFAGTVLLGLLSLLLWSISVQPTWKIYWVEKINDWSGICSYMRNNARPDDVITGDSYYHGVMYWCFHILPGAPVGTIADPGEYSLTQLVSSDKTVWYIHIDPGAPNAGYIKQEYDEVPRSAWARQDLIVTFSDGDRLLYPQAEHPASLYFREANAGEPTHLVDITATNKIIFHDEAGKYRNPTWPDFVRIAPGRSYSVPLSLPAIAPRLLRITYLNLPSRNFEVLVNGSLMANVVAGTTAGDWSTIEISLPDGTPGNFQLEFRNPGEISSAVSEVEVIYAGDRH